MTKKHGVSGLIWWTATVALAVVVAGLTASAPAQRDRGVNQAGAAGKSQVDFAQA